MPPSTFCRSTRSRRSSSRFSAVRIYAPVDAKKIHESDSPNMNVKLPNDYAVMVLLVDDQAMVGEAIRRALANQPNIDFHYCANPADALRIAGQIKPTVILQDLVMPGVDGLTLVRQ